jgi:hypothetical protein
MLVYNNRIAADALLNMLHIEYIALYHGEFNYYAVLTIDNGILLSSYVSDHQSHQKLQYLQFYTM